MELDNQQLSIARWLAGFIDGDGHISFAGKPSKGGRIVVALFNTKFRAIKIAIDFCDKFQIEYKIHIDKRQVHHKEIYRLYIYKQKSVYRFLTLIKDHLIIKRKKANLSLQFLESRFKTPKNKQYSPLEFSLIKEIKSNESSETKDVSLLNTDWFSGFIDAEGCFTVLRNNRKHGRMSITPIFVLTQKEASILELIYYWLKEKQVGSYLATYKSGTQLIVKGLKRFTHLRTLNLQLNLKDQVKNLVDDFCDSRLAKSRIEPFSHNELQLVEQIREMKI